MFFKASKMGRYAFYEKQMLELELLLFRFNGISTFLGHLMPKPSF